MNGPANYREAETLLDLAHESRETTFEGHNPEADRMIDEALVRALLALAAATALSAPDRGATVEAVRSDRRAWDDVAGVPLNGGDAR